MDEKLSQLSTDKDANLLRDDARTLVNGYIGIASGKWDFSFWGENLFNTKYIVEQDVNGYMGFIEKLWGQPRLLGLRISYKIYIRLLFEYSKINKIEKAYYGIR